MIKKGKKPNPSSRVEMMSFDPGCYIEIVDAPTKRSKTAPARKARVQSNGKNGLAIEDRQRLRDIEVWLNNCVSRASGMQTKRAAKLVEQLCLVRSQVQQLRG